MEYNTQQRRLPLPEYGRSVQNMVDHALTIEDREQRQICANTIVKIMRGMFPQLKDTAEVNQRLWDHLAIMSDFKLDIDYPVEVVRKESLDVKPEKVPYPQSKLKYRHYGRFVQDMIDVAVKYDEGEEKKQLVNLIANQMRKDYLAWNKDSMDNQKIVEDLFELSGGKIKVALEDIKFFDLRSYNQRRRTNNNNNNNQQRKRNG